MMRRWVLKGLYWYQQYRSLHPPACRFAPSCSAYAYSAVRQHGVVRGGWLTVRRVSRCHPLGGQGYDPVPTNLTNHHV